MCDLDFFIFGLGAFLVAQVIYTIIFATRLERKRHKIPLVLGIFVFGGALAWILVPKLGELMIPVLVYMGVILAMGITATSPLCMNTTPARAP